MLNSWQSTEADIAPRELKPDLVRVWTVQPLAVWEQVEQLGVAAVDPNRMSDGYVPLEYRWLVTQLRQRLPGYAGDLPWWAYCARPDLRWVRHRWPRNQREVRMEVLLPAEEVFVMPCWAWETVFFGKFLSFDNKERLDWERRLREAVPDEDLWPLPEPWQAEVEASWERLFDPALPQSSDHEFHGRLGATREAVFGLLRRPTVCRVTHFVGTGSWR
jgi:hypothetical protein